MRNQVYELITERILAEMEKGIVPWRKPWTDGRPDLPMNMVTRKPYRGVNTWMLWNRYASPYWGTFNQAKAAGGSVRKGEHGTPVIFWSIYDDPKNLDPKGKPTKRFVLRYYTVFNIEQMDLPDEVRAKYAAPARELPPIEAAEHIIAELRNAPEVQHGGNRAAYSPGRDVILMPDRAQFETPEGYYDTLFHEEVHATGHKSRLDRPGVQGVATFGDEVYSREELVAELGAAFLCGHAGIDRATLANSAAYIRSWAQALRDDPKLVVQAASAAQKAADYILGVQEAAGEDNDTLAQAA